MAAVALMSGPAPAVEVVGARLQLLLLLLPEFFHSFLRRYSSPPKNWPARSRLQVLWTPLLQQLC